jgi:hypothetical protein
MGNNLGGVCSDWGSTQTPIKRGLSQSGAIHYTTRPTLQTNAAAEGGFIILHITKHAIAISDEH